MAALITHWYVAIPGVVIVFVAWALWQLCGMGCNGSDDD